MSLICNQLQTPGRSGFVGLRGQCVRPETGKQMGRSSDRPSKVHSGGAASSMIQITIHLRRADWVPRRRSERIGGLQDLRGLLLKFPDLRGSKEQVRPLLLVKV